jgi:fucose 4-O-acetylase-like acetyltransferase
MRVPLRASTAEPRLLWIDTARGIGIFLVVYAHVLRGQFHAGLLAWSPAVDLQDRAIYAFHMPFFFLLSGLFAGSKIQSRTQFVARRLVTIVYPYILWSVVQTLLSMGAGQYANRPGALADLLLIGIHPIGQFWFLYVLAVFQLLLLLPRPSLLLLVPVGILVFLYFDQGSLLIRAGWYLVFFAAGVFIGRRGMETALPTRARALAWLLGGSILFALLFVTTASLTGAMALLAHFALATTGIAAALGLARLLDGRISLLPALGAASLAIFVLHVICGAAMRAGLERLGLHQPATAIALVTAAGLLIPLIFYKLSVIAKLTPWLGLGFAPHPRLRVTGSTGKPYTPLEPIGRKADVGSDQARGPAFQ